MIPTLRPRQEQFVDDIRTSLRSHRVLVAQAPTGFGKSVVMAYMTASAIGKGRRVWLSVHRSYLLDQIAETFDRFRIDYGFCAAGRPFNPHKRAVICSIDTLRNRLDRMPPPDVMLVDEGHHAVSTTWARSISTVRDAGGRVVLLTATPERLDGRGLGDLAGDLVSGPSTAWLIGNGDLSRYRAYAPTAPDLSDVRTTAGDYNAGDLGAVMDRAVLIGDMVGHWQKHAAGLRSVYFCTSINHSRHVAAAFNQAGIPAMHVDGETPTNERLDAARRFGRGEIRVLTNCALVSEGYDLASQAGMDVSIDCVGMARPTQSLAMYLQQVGRGLRVSPGKDACVILDHAGNIGRHGLPDDEREWSLEGTRRTRKSEPSAPSARTCTECFGAFRATLRACPYCGTPVQVQVREIEQRAGDLAEVDAEAIRRARSPHSQDKSDRLREQGMARTMDQLIALGRARGTKNPESWAAYVSTSREKARKRAAQIKAEAQYAAYAR